MRIKTSLTTLKNFKFSQSDADKCAYVGRINDDVVYIALHVDDGVLIAKSAVIKEL